MGSDEPLYPEIAAAEHSRVLIAIARDHLRNESGLWFVDRDVSLQANAANWLIDSDERQASLGTLPCTSAGEQMHSVTQTAFRLSPTRLPTGSSGFDPIAFQSGKEAQRPDLYRFEGALRIPDKNTLIQARDELAKFGQVACYGGMRTTVSCVVDFFASCPRRRLALEDPVLLHRIDEFAETLQTGHTLA